MAKVTYHIKLGEFEFVEVTEEGEYSKAREVELRNEIKEKTGLPDKEWRELIDTYLWTTDGMNPEQYALLNKEQQWMVQEVKKSKKRELYKVLQREQDEINHIKSIQGEDV